MTQDERKRPKFPQVHKHFTKVIEPEFTPNWNYQPREDKRDNHRLTRLIRSQIKPFQPEQKPEMSPQGLNSNLRKVIDFSLASLTESSKRHHCRVLAGMCQRIADCRNATNTITEEQLYVLFEIHAWQCPKTGVKHSIRTPLSIEFKQPIWQGGRVAISNCLPVFNGCLPGEYHFIPAPDYLQVMVA